MIKRYVYFLLICLSIILLEVIVFNNKYTYEPSWYKGHLSEIQKQLKEIKTELQEYNKNNSRYPTSDEGLSVLDDLKARLQEKYPDKSFEKYIYDNIDTYGTMDEAPYKDIRFSKAGILDYWAMPYVYENRSEKNSSIFKDSPVNSDHLGSYSIKVDNDIYVYSVGAIRFYNEYNKIRIEKYSLIGLSLTLLIVFIVLYRKARKKEEIKKENIFITIIRVSLSTVAIIVAIAAGMFFGNPVTCYVMSRFDKREYRPEMISMYNNIIEKYFKSGVIKEETYNKMKKTMDEETKRINKRVE